MTQKIATNFESNYGQGVTHHAGWHFFHNNWIRNESMYFLASHLHTIPLKIYLLNRTTWFVKLNVNINRITGPTRGRPIILLQDIFAFRHGWHEFILREFPKEKKMENQSPVETTAGACVDQVPVVECTKIILIRHQVFCFEMPYLHGEFFSGFDKKRTFKEGPCERLSAGERELCAATCKRCRGPDCKEGYDRFKT